LQPPAEIAAEKKELGACTQSEVKELKKKGEIKKT